MFCGNCGSPVPDGVKFCPACGEPVASGQQVGSTGGYVPQPSPVTPGSAPYAGPVTTSRSLLTWFLLTLVTCGIYDLYFVYKLAQDTNAMCAGDGEETPGIVPYILLSIVTCGFYALYWDYKLGNRLQRNAPRYGLAFQESGTTILLWEVVGSLLCCIGPFIAMNIIIRNMNSMALAYNARHALR